MAVATSWADLLEGEEIAYSGVEPSREATLEPLPDDLDPRVASALAANGVSALFRHQAETWEAAQRGENVVVTTGTASGKSLAFNLPVLDAIAREREPERSGSEVAEGRDERPTRADPSTTRCGDGDARSRGLVFCSLISCFRRRWSFGEAGRLGNS